MSTSISFAIVHNCYMSHTGLDAKVICLRQNIRFIGENTVLKRILISIISVLIIFAQALYAQSIENISSASTSTDVDGLEVSISFHNKSIYYPSETPNNPINVNVSITNKGSETLRFKIADDRAFSLDVDAFSIRNENLSYADTLVRKRTTSSTVYFRELALESEESYGFTIDLKDYIQINDPSVYYIEVNLYPELYKSKLNTVTSNRLALEISPNPIIGASTLVPVNFDSGAILRPEFLPPDQVIEHTIIARQRSLWDQFFLYMDLESIYFKNPQNKTRYNNSSENERQKILQNYKLSLMSDRVDSDIVAVPEQFEIERTTYTQNEGVVTVIEWFKYPNYRERKRYTYYLRLRNNIWQIYDYTVDNLGTEE